MRVGARSRWATLIIVGTATALETIASPTKAEVVVVPNASAAVQGNFGTIYPFSCASNALMSQRLQQVYMGTEVGSGTITEIRFRQHGTGSAFGPTTLPNVTIALSTTSAPVDSLDLTFANNVGSDVTTVFSGDLTLSSAACSSTPCPFDIVIPLSTPFPFDASAGNLLLDVTIPTCAVTTEFNGVNMNDSVSRVFTVGSGSTSPTADIPSTRGLITLFNVFTRPAPTLSTWGMAALLVALLGFGVVTARRRSRM